MSLRETLTQQMVNGRAHYRELTQEVEDLIVALIAHMRYLQEDFCSIVVGGSLGTKTQQIFRLLQKHTSAFAPSVIETVKTAAQLASIPSESVNAPQQGNLQQRSRFGKNKKQSRGRGGSFRGRSRYSEPYLDSQGYRSRSVPRDRPSNIED